MQSLEQCNGLRISWQHHREKVLIQMKLNPQGTWVSRGKCL